ncbi:hypothetical protein L226DRAFT_561711 [Lentinus tigrinus ALCF2SS1-7]|uniref:Acid protease n=1 Tax=Lentinus tigrinus ALCF2SS1-6 TaxID=1328759 RepID=A0A5C2S643_9APHY|nr:hypothetical protein L227DRAFT_601840 [Lentinus tigrinus ALCF2SS1-6]RPD72813.1 hypothetical protein L226DRAFT_561711 [Lentinus tigrinus ALCF2SS1-7]
MFVSLSRVLLAAALAVSVLAAPENPTRTTRDVYADVHPIGVATRSLAMKPPLTNAQRLARGQPPNRPRRTYGARSAQALQPRQSATPCIAQSTGKIGVYSGADMAGYLSASVNAFGEYGTTTDEFQALSVVLCQSTGVHDIYVQNGLADYPWLGLISGAVNTNDNMSPSSYNYAYVGGTARSTPAVSGDNSFTGATGNARKIESTVWSLGSDNTLTASWVNSNGARVTGVIVHVVSGTDDAFVITAGYSDYVDMFGPSPIWSFKFIPLLE